MGDPAYDQFFRSPEQAGMTDKQWEKYLEQRDRTKSKAKSTLDAKLLKELYDRRSKEWKEEKAPLIVEERDRLSKEPVYQILADIKEFPMDYDAVKELGGGKIPGKMIGKAKKGGVDPAEYAETYGFDSPAAMIRAIDKAPSLKEAADQAAEDRMIAKHGDILNDGSIEAEVREAIHNEEQAKLVLDELTALKRKLGGKQAVNREYLKAEARAIIAGMKFKYIKPG